MAAKTYNLTLNKNNNTSSSCAFTIPQMQGTYNLKLKLGSGNAIDAGNIVVDSTERVYRLVLGLSDGTSIDAGTFTTPIADGNQLLPPVIVDHYQDNNSTIEVFVTNNNPFEVECYLQVCDQYGGVFGSAFSDIPANWSGYSIDVSLSSSLDRGTVEAHFSVNNDGDVIDSETVLYIF